MPIGGTKRKLKEELKKTSEIIESGLTYQRTDYTPAYIDAVFTAWYSAGKVTARRLSTMLPNPSEFGIALNPPAVSTLMDWIKERFMERAIALDEAVGLQMNNRLIAEKVQMLEHHAQIAAKMQEMALEYLESHADKLNPNSAVRLLVEGVRIERDSRGIPQTLDKLADRSDEELLAQIEDVLTRSTVNSYPIDEEIPDEDAL